MGKIKTIAVNTGKLFVSLALLGLMLELLKKAGGGKFSDAARAFMANPIETTKNLKDILSNP